MDIPAKFTESGLTMEEVKAAYDNRTPVTVEGFTGYVNFYDPIHCENGGTRFFYMSRTIEEMEDLDAPEYGPFCFIRPQR